MDENNEFNSSEDRDDEEPKTDLAASTLIGANINASNTGYYPGGVVGPASDTAEIEEVEEVKEAEETQKTEEADEDLGEMKFDALAQFGSDKDQGAASGQSESGSDTSRS